MKGSVSAFWDTSALAPLCCRQVSTSVARELFRRYSHVVAWWAARVELVNSLHRLVRTREIRNGELAYALNRASILIDTWREILPTGQVRSLAIDSAGRFPLNTADAFQLAAALVWCKERPRKRPFICFDRTLQRAAADLGFEVHPLP